MRSGCYHLVSSVDCSIIIGETASCSFRIGEMVASRHGKAAVPKRVNISVHVLHTFPALHPSSTKGQHLSYKQWPMYSHSTQHIIDLVVINVKDAIELEHQ